MPHFSLMKETKSSKSLPPPYSSPSLLPFGKNFNVGNPLTPYLDIQQWHSFLQGCNIENASFTDNQAYLLKFHLLLSQIDHELLRSLHTPCCSQHLLFGALAIPFNFYKIKNLASARYGKLLIKEIYT